MRPELGPASPSTSGASSANPARRPGARPPATAEVPPPRCGRPGCRRRSPRGRLLRSPPRASPAAPRPRRRRRRCGGRVRAPRRRRGCRGGRCRRARPMARGPQTVFERDLISPTSAAAATNLLRRSRASPRRPPIRRYRRCRRWPPRQRRRWINRQRWSPTPPLTSLRSAPQRRLGAATRQLRRAAPTSAPAVARAMSKRRSEEASESL
mmetsp:Transcript_118382/g.379523  ORF Transcript_118382/g.379523 Transcript_118382/m.379523 type:complete len:210 (-) Transcript_118382:18-647(-)